MSGLNNLPKLDGWITLGEAAEILGITRQHAYRRARLANEGKRGGWKSVHRLGSKPSYVVLLGEVIYEKRARERGEHGDLHHV